MGDRACRGLGQDKRTGADGPEDNPTNERGFANTVAPRNREPHSFAKWKTVTDCTQHPTLPWLWMFAGKLGRVPIKRLKDKLQRIAGIERQLISELYKLCNAASSLNSSGLALRSIASQWHRSGAQPSWAPWRGCSPVRWRLTEAAKAGCQAVTLVE